DRATGGPFHKLCREDRGAAMMGILLTLPLVTSGFAQVSAAPTPTVSQAADVASETPVAPSDREAELLARIRQLEAELREEQARSLRRQQEWIEYTRVLKTFSSRIPDPPEFVAEALKPVPDPVAEHEARERARLAKRAKAIEQSLRSLLAVEGVRNIDLLEVGRPVRVDGRAGTGPVIGRLLDDRGRMTGMIKAERMWIEPSRSGRTVTIVMKDGYESRQGVKRSFDGGIRRLFLGAVDPEPWIEAFPDLIEDADIAPVIDDGLWDLTQVRARIARLLSKSTEAGGANWHLAGLGGVREGELRDVQFAEMDRVTGKPTRRVFADVAKIRALDGGGIVIEMKDGTVRRGSRAAAFLDGRFRLILPFADASAWRAAELPGLFTSGL
ncbi:MAG: hypothetical protein AAGG01_17440, partial [Planctomycetota bacterium]